MSKELREIKISMIADLRYFGWEVSSDWSFSKLKKTHAYLVEFISLMLLHVDSKNNGIVYMEEFIVECGLNFSGLEEFCVRNGRPQDTDKIKFLGDWIKALVYKRGEERQLFRLFCIYYFRYLGTQGYLSWCDAAVADLFVRFSMK